MNDILLNVRRNFLRERTRSYADGIKAAGALLWNRLGFIDCTKIRINRLQGHGNLQRSCYSGQKRFHCLMYQTLTTPVGLVFFLYGAEVGCWHDLTLHVQRKWEFELKNYLNVDGEQ